MLLILTSRDDYHTKIVVSKLKNQIDYFILNLDIDSLKNTIIKFCNGEWIIKQDKQTITSAEISSVWCREAFVKIGFDERDLLNDNDFKIFKNEWNATLNGLYVSLYSKKWLNPLSKAFMGENKYYQMKIASEIKLKMPKTMISNDKNELINFSKMCNDDIILKPMKQTFYEFKDGSFGGFYTNRISTDDLKNFNEQNENPIFLQEYIAKDYEVRYTFVDGRHFVCKIDSQKSKIANEDWRRYDLGNTPHIAIKPPSDIKEKVNLLIKRLGLRYGALDFIVTPTNEWIFLEINCFGQWLWIENLSGLDISGAICDWAIANTSK